jgi:hypothetical protein
MAGSPRREYDREFRVLDQMLTMHSLLRDRLQRHALMLTVAILALSIAATAASFGAGEPQLRVLWITARVQAWVGLLTTIIFFLTLIDLRVDWKQRAGAHAEAARRLGELKARFRAAMGTEAEVEGAAELKAGYDRTMAGLVPIPERLFLKLKAKHLRKVEISKLLDRHAGAPLMYLRARVVIKGLTAKSPKTEGPGGPPDTS